MLFSLCLSILAEILENRLLLIAEPLVDPMLSLRASRSQRKIIHCDADCFFAAVETRDDPLLLGRPMAVGGEPERRGVVATCNYEARRYGIHSAMSSAKAKQLCPELVLLPPRFDVYKQASQQMREIFFEYADLIEPLSLDEAFLDVSQSIQCQGSATRMAEEIRQKIEERVGITVSAGVAPNKFLAKVCSDWHKPNGLTVLPPAQVDVFVQALPVNCIFGVGKVTAAKLKRLGIETCGDLRRYTVFDLLTVFGSFGQRLYDLSRGIDNRPVVSSHRRKSLSVEHTYPKDMAAVEQCLQQLPSLLIDLNTRLQKIEVEYRIAKQFVKVKFSNFQTTTMECVSHSTDMRVFLDLMQQACRRSEKSVRLLGLGVRFVDRKAVKNLRQLHLFEQ